MSGRPSRVNVPEVERMVNDDRPGGEVYFLGGQDLEMLAIAELVGRVAPGRVVDKRLPWGAKVSDYGAEIDAALRAGRAVVLVDLDDDLGLSGGPDAVRVVAIDHHGNRAGADRPTSLEQGCERLDRPWEHATGPRMPEDKARSARNGRAHRKAEKSAREIKEELAGIMTLLRGMAAARQGLRRHADDAPIAG